MSANLKRRTYLSVASEKTGCGGYEVQRAQKQDLDGILFVMEQARLGMRNPEWFVCDDRDYIEAHLDGKKGFTVVAKKQGSREVVGFFVIKYPEVLELQEFSLEKEENFGMQVVVMDSTAVAHAHRGHGLQGRLLEYGEKELRKEARGKGLFLVSTVHPDNCYSLNNMRKHGYGIQKEIVCYGGKRRYLLSKKII